MDKKVGIRQHIDTEKYLETKGIYWVSPFGYSKNITEDSCEVVSVGEVDKHGDEYIDNKLRGFGVAPELIK